jgi:hypothetical protein
MRSEPDDEENIPQNIQRGLKSGYPVSKQLI